MSVSFNAATRMNISILQSANSQFQVAQKRVASGKSIFGAADDATRYTMSETMFRRASQLDSVNNSISLSVSILSSTDRTLKEMLSLATDALDRAQAAQKAVGTATVATTGATALAAGANTLVTGAVQGSKFQITSDNGKTATYVFGANPSAVTWGEIANSINAQNIGVKLEFIAGTGTTATLKMSATDGATGFRIDGDTDVNVIDDIGTITSGTGEAFNAANMFATAAAAPGVGKEGFLIASGGSLTMTGTALTSKTTTIAAGSATAPQSLTFVGGDGLPRTWTGTVATSYQSFVDQINAMQAGVKAEFVNGGGNNFRIRLRNTEGGEMKILNGSGVFTSGGTNALRFSNTTGQTVITGAPGPQNTDTAAISKEGKQFDTNLQDITHLIANNPVESGRNLLQGQSVSVYLSAFGGQPLVINGVAVSTASLGFTAAAGGTNWASNAASIQTAIDEANAAIKSLTAMQVQFSGSTSYIKTRQASNKDYSDYLNTLGDGLVEADVSEESAKLTALQTQQQFAVQAFSMGTQNSQGLLRLLQ